MMSLRFVLIAFACSFARCVVAGSQSYLYAGTTTAVKEYMPEENDPRLLFMNIKAPRVVEFYSPSCPACVTFSSSYKKLAANTKKKHPSIQFFAVSCDKFSKLCEEYNAEDYPTMRLFQKQDGPDSRGKTAEFDAEDAEDLRAPDKLAKYLKVDIKSGSQDGDGDDDSTKAPGKNDSKSKDEGGVGEDEDKSTKARDDRNSKSKNEDSSEDGDNAVQTEDGDNAVPETEGPTEEPKVKGPEAETEEPKVKEPEDNSKSKDSDEDGDDDDDEGDDDEFEDQYVSQHKDRVENYARKRQGLRKFIYQDGSKDASGNSIETLKFNETTKGMRQYTSGTQEYRQRREAILKRIQLEKGRQRGRLRFEKGELTKSNLPYAKVVRKPKLMRKISHEEELMLDVTRSLVISLLQGNGRGIEDESAKVALKKWLDLLSVSLPPEWEIHRLIDYLRSNLSKSTKEKDTFRDIVEPYLPPSDWSKSCRNKHLNTDGFTCGFWKLLHVITIGVAEQRGGKNLVETRMMPEGTAVFSPGSAADTIRNYIDMFFTCRPCREHFISTYDNCENNRRCKRLTTNQEAKNPGKWKELSLWLWEVHNDVSVRLVGERTKKPTSATEVWPNVDTCVLCFNSDGKWNKGEVFRFLERTYWPDSESDPLNDKLLMFDVEGTSGAMTLWLLALAILFLVYKLIGKNSQAIRQPLVAARLIASRVVSKKGRSV